MKKVLIIVICTLANVGECQDVVQEISHNIAVIAKAIDHEQLNPKMVNNLRQINELLEKHSDINAQNEDGNTPLMLLAELAESFYHEINGKKIPEDVILEIEDIAENVLKSGADAYIKNKTGGTALERMLGDLRGYWLISAIRSEREDLVKLLLNGSSVNAKDIMGNTPLIWAVRSNNSLNIAKLLIDQGAEVNAVNCCHDSALMTAANTLNIEFVKLLLQHPKIDINTRGFYGTTVLKAMKETAKHREDERIIEIIKILEEAGARE